MNDINNEKDIAKQPVKSKMARWGMGYDYYDWECPTCGAFLAPEPAEDEIPRRCQYCGQLLKVVK